MEVGRFFNQESMDLNALYQPDIDLGVNWPLFEPVKTVKGGNFEEKLSFDPKDYIVDGETGEYLPIPQRDESQQKPIMDDDGETGQTSEFNIEEFLESSINTGISAMNVRPVNEQQFQQVQSGPETINTELWDDIATLSEAYLALDSGEFANEGMSDRNSPMEDNSQFSPVNQYRSDVFGNQAQIQMQQQQKCQQEDQYFAIEGPYNSFPTPPYSEQTKSPPAFAHPTSVTFPPEDNKQFGPADLGEVKLAEMLLTQQSQLLTQLDTVSQTNLVINSSPINVEEVPVPGSWFFGGEENGTNFSQALTELDVINSLHNQTGSYMNPSNAPLVPPPISTQGRVSMGSESESLDSGFNDVGRSRMDMEVIDVESTSVLMQVEESETYLQQEMIREAKMLRKQSLRESRDMKKARDLNITLTMEQIVNTQVEEYNELIARSNLNVTQQSLIRDIRRRGKNKVAAQNCRKRKIETISSMEIDIEELNMKRQDLLDKQQEIEETRRSIQANYNQLHQQIFSSLRDDAGRLYDQSRFSLQQFEGAIILVPDNHGNRMAAGQSKQESKGAVAFFDLSKVKFENDI